MDDGDNAKHRRRRKREQDVTSERSSVGGYFTEGEVEALIDMHERGVSKVDIALKLGRTLGSVKSKLNRLVKDGLTASNLSGWTPTQDTIVADMLAAGMTRSAIAKHVGRTRVAVEIRLRNLGYGGEGSRLWTAAEETSLRKLSQVGITDKQIAKVLGRSRMAITQRRRDLKIWK